MGENGFRNEGNLSWNGRNSRFCINQTKVKWGFNGHMNYPMNLMFLFMDFEKMIDDDLETGLYNLKTALEKQHVLITEIT
ncbi:MAG: hypothetical protein WD426_13810 [Anditalea sp.]